MSKRYLLDTNTFIQPAKTFYGFDICPGFWKFLKREFATGNIFSIEKVYSELQSIDDVLFRWTKSNLGKVCFADQASDKNVVASYNNAVAPHVLNNTQYHGYAKRNFLADEEADPWICAYALTHDCIVVTQEVPSPDAKRRVPLANVLNHFQVEYIDLYACLRQLKAQFELV